MHSLLPETDPSLQYFQTHVDLKNLNHHLPLYIALYALSLFQLLRPRHILQPLLYDTVWNLFLQYLVLTEQ